MKRLTLAIGLAFTCVIPVHAQDATVIVKEPDTVIVKDPDPPTPAIKETTTTTTSDHYDTTSTSTHSSPRKVAHHPVQHHPVHHVAVAYHRPVRSHPVTSQASTDTQTTTQTTVTIPPRIPTADVSENADGSVTVTTTRPAAEVPADQSSGQDDGHY